ncbi:GTP-binding protein [Citricoccus sp.]|uniref:GTP-binding protein n=1 Tax=Citricoccus sp. TaxID=1978372 RepID=UPI0028BD4E8D|nr:GTP-binding protein [Citricoccus sp.]
MISQDNARRSAGVPVLAVVGTRPDARLEYATELARTLDRQLVTSFQLRAAEDPVSEASRLTARVQTPAGAVVEIPDRVSTAELAAGLSSSASAARLEGVICVVDAAHGVQDLFREDYLVPRSGHPSMATARSLVSITHVEHASLIALVNWEDVPTDELRTVLALVHHLSPRARVRLLEDLTDIAETLPDPTTTPGYDARLDRPGWVNLLSNSFETFIHHDRVVALHYDCARPFHPVRMHELVHELMSPERFGTVVRSAGYCRVASSANVTGHWNHVGKVMALSPVSLDDDLELLLDPWADTDPLTVGQSLAFIGLDLDREELVSALDRAVLTDEEFLAGPSAWAEQVKRLR